MLPRCKKLDKDKRFVGNSLEIAGGNIDDVGGALSDGDGDESKGGQGTKEGRELHDGRGVRG